jgi:23S rRNA (cytosine1962-C5)-methyltransferase
MATLVIRKGRIKPLRGRHPWVFSSSIAEVRGEPVDGEPVDLTTPDGNFLGRALYSAQAALRARIFSFKPGVEFDRELIAARLRAARDMRRDVLGLPSAETTGYRLVHSEGDGLPGVVVDVYGSALVVQLSIAATDRRRELIFDLLEELLAPTAIIEASDSHRELEGLPPAEGLRRGHYAGESIVHERGLLLAADLAGGQKTGLYFDQRDNRARIEQLARDRTVLDAFCYRGGFALAAARGGARSVTAVDSSGAALVAGEACARANGLGAIEWQRDDAYRLLGEARRTGQQWGLVVLDPPRYATRRDQRDAALQKYRELYGLGIAATAPGGVMLACSCSGTISPLQHEEVLRDATAVSDRDVRIIARGGQAPDHPTSASCPEGNYLKALFCVVGS